MFSLYESKMNSIVGYEPSDDNRLSDELLYMMMYFQDYLDNDWSLKKRKSCYILFKNNRKIIVPDSIYLTNLDKTNTFINNIPKIKKNNSVYFDDDKSCNDENYLLYFMFNTLKNGWTVKKSSKIDEKYAFIKRHEGKKEYFSNNYIHTFLKENFNFKLIK